MSIKRFIVPLVCAYTINKADCEEQGSIEVNCTGGLSPYNYTWSNGSQEAINSGLSPGTYQLTIEDAYNAITNDIIQLGGFDQFDSWIDASQECGIVQAHYQGGSSNVSYSWSSGDTESQVTLENGFYTITITDLALDCYHEHKFEVSSNQEIIADFNTISNATSVTFTNLSSNYNLTNWNFGDGSSSNLENPTHTYSDFGTYVVTLIVYNTLCETSDTINQTIVITEPTSIGNQTDQAKISIAPNPFNNGFEIHWNNVPLNNFEIQLFNSTGAEMFKAKVNPNSNSSFVNLQNFAAGIYLLRIIDENGNHLFVEKVIKL